MEISKRGILSITWPKVVEKQSRKPSQWTG